jgi:hypothetical protein
MVNHVPTVASADLAGRLRSWGFTGYRTTDGDGIGGISDTNRQNYTRTSAEAIRLAMTDGESDIDDGGTYVLVYLFVYLFVRLLRSSDLTAFTAQRRADTTTCLLVALSTCSLYSLSSLALVTRSFIHSLFTRSLHSLLVSSSLAIFTHSLHLLSSLTLFTHSLH